jgi:hypothetical protein
MQRLLLKLNKKETSAVLTSTAPHAQLMLKMLNATSKVALELYHPTLDLLK